MSNKKLGWMLLAVLMILALALTACGSKATEAPTAEPMAATEAPAVEPTAEPTAPAAPAEPITMEISGQVEVFSWWTG
ncbi:MAG TPA: hypothetical protein DEH22_01335, partial [Chloroflexi bacterium]|nr:hypothetical protein [Chloroflexota bacterium]